MTQLKIVGALTLGNACADSSRHQRGFSTLAWLLGLPVLLVALLILAVIFYEGRKAYWDAQVKEMCAKDGHVQIYEKVPIRKKELDEMLRDGGGVISLKTQESARFEDVVYVEIKEKNIREMNPRVRRTEWRVIRQENKKVVAAWNSYGRIGGDVPTGLMHDSSFRCPDWKQTWIELRELFLVKEN